MELALADLGNLWSRTLDYIANVALIETCRLEGHLLPTRCTSFHRTFEARQSGKPLYPISRQDFIKHFHQISLRKFFSLGLTIRRQRSPVTKYDVLVLFSWCFSNSMGIYDYFMWCKIFSLLEKNQDPPPLLFHYRIYYFITYHSNAGDVIWYWLSKDPSRGCQTTSTKLIFKYCLRLLLFALLADRSWPYIDYSWPVIWERTRWVEANSAKQRLDDRGKQRILNGLR